MVEASSLLELANTARDAKRWADAAALFQQYLDASPRDAAAMRSQGFCIWASGDLDRAIDTYRCAANLDPTSVETHNALGSILRQKGDNRAALLEYQEAVALDPLHAYAQGNLGDMLYRLGRYKDAEVHFRAAIAVRPEWPDAHEYLGRILLWQNDLTAAQAAVAEAIRLHPKRYSAHAALASIYSKRDMHAEAERALAVALHARPDNASYWSQHAWQLWRAQRYVDAEQAAHGAMLRDASLPYPHYLLGGIAELMSNPERAIGHYCRYLELDPADREGAALRLSALGATVAPERAPVAYLEKIYALRAPHWDKLSERYRGHRMMEDLLRSAIGDARDLDVMDAGCGTGGCAGFLRPHARLLHGVDLSPAMLEKARQHALYDELVEGELETMLRSRPARYDLIVSAATLIHFGDLGGPIDAAATALRPGGRMIFTVFKHDSDGFGILPFHCHGHSEAHVRERAQAAGFDIVSIGEDIHEYHEQTPVHAFGVILRKPARDSAPRESAMTVKTRT